MKKYECEEIQSKLRSIFLILFQQVWAVLVDTIFFLWGGGGWGVGVGTSLIDLIKYKLVSLYSYNKDKIHLEVLF